MKKIQLIDACEERHFRDMSRLHALGWRAAWGELVSLYSHPDHWGQGYSSAVMEEVLHRMIVSGYPGCFLYVLLENYHARQFYEKHGFSWDGHSMDVPLTQNIVLTDLCYCKEL